MTLIPYLLFIFVSIIAKHSALEEINTAIALKAAKDNPVLLKILQTVDAATSNERLFDVTLNILKSLCVCMRETLRKKQLESFQLRREMKSLQTEDDIRESNRKVLDIYQNIYNKTCFDLREELAMKVNKSGNLTPQEEKDFMDHSNCGKKTIDENTEDYERLTSQLTQIVEYKSNLKKILRTTFVSTRTYHKFHMRKFNLFKNSQKSPQHSVKHSIIVILTFYPHRNSTHISDSSTEVSTAELNRTLYTPSPIDIDVIDTRYGRKENSRDEDFIPKPATDCSLKSIYSFLLQSEQVNKTKVFKMLRKKGTIKVYIDIPTQINHIDYSKVCCSNETETPLCNVDFSRERFDSHEITTYLPEFKKRKKILGDYKDTISKIKNLVKLYDRKLNGNKLNQLNSKTNKHNTKSKFNNIITDIGKKLLVAKKDGDNIILSKDKYFKLPFRSKFNDSYPDMKSVAVEKNFKNQYITEKYVLENINSFNESGMNTTNKDSAETKDSLRPTFHDNQNSSVRLKEGYKVKLINLTKPTASTEIPKKSITWFEKGFEDNTDTNASYANDNKSAIFESSQKLQTSTAYDQPITFDNYFSAEEPYQTHRSNEFKTKTEMESIQNTAAENQATDSSRKTTADNAEMFSVNANINNNTIDYSDSAKIFKMTENYSQQRDSNKNIEEPSIITMDNYQISTTIRMTPSIKKNYNTELNNFDGTNAMTTNRNINNENYEVTSERLKEKETEKRTNLPINEKLSNPLSISTDKYLIMQQKTFQVAGIMNKTLSRNHTESTNYLRVKEKITDNWNAVTLSNLSDMNIVTTNFQTPVSNFSRKNSSTSIANHNDDSDFKSLVSSKQLNSELIDSKGLLINKMNLSINRDKLFHNSAKPEIPILFIDNDIEEKSKFTRKPDEITILRDFEMTQQYNNIFDSFKTIHKISSSTNNDSKSVPSQTTEAVRSVQLLQPELKNNTSKNNKKRDGLKTTDIPSKSMKKSTVNNVLVGGYINKDTESTYSDETYVTEEIRGRTKKKQKLDNKLKMTKIFNTRYENDIETNAFETFLHRNRNLNDSAHDIENTKAEMKEISTYYPSIEHSLNTAIPLTTIAITDNITKKNSEKDELLKQTMDSDTPDNSTRGINWTKNSDSSTVATADRIKFGKYEYFVTKEMHGKSNTNFIIPKISKLMSSKSITGIDNDNAPGSVKPYLKMKKRLKGLGVDERETKTNIFEENSKLTTKPYSDDKYYVQNVDTTFFNLPNKISHLDTEKIYNFTLSKMSGSDKLSKAREELDKTESYASITVLQNTKKKNSTNLIKSTFYELKKNSQYIRTSPKTTEVGDNDKKLLGNITAATTQLTFKHSTKPHESIDSFSFMGGLKSSKEFSDYSGDEERNDLIKEENNTLKVATLSNKEQLLPSQALKMQTEIEKFSIDKFTTTLSANIIPELVKDDSSTAIRQQQTNEDKDNRSDSLSKTTKLNNTTKRRTKSVATKNIGKTSMQTEFNFSDIEQYSSKANKSRITRSPSAIKHTIGTYNKNSSLSTTVPLSDNLVIKLSTSAVQNLNESNRAKSLQSPEISKHTKFAPDRAKSQFSTTVDPDLNKKRTDETITPRTEKYREISKNDQQITSNIISPNIIQNTDSKKIIAELHGFTDFAAWNKTGDEHYDVKSINDIVNATIQTDRNTGAYSDRPYDFIVKEPQSTSNINISQLNYEKTDKNAKEQYEIRYTEALHPTTNLPQSIIYDAKNIAFETPHDIILKEKKVDKDLKLGKQIDDLEVKSTVTDKYVEVSLKPKIEEPFDTQLIQSLQLFNFSDSQNNSKSSSFERTNNGIDSEAPNSLEDINNDFKDILKFLNESSHLDQQSTSTTHNVLISDTQARLIDNLTVTQQPVSVINFTTKIAENTTESGTQQENENNTYIFTKKEAKNINIHNLSTVTELINNLNLKSDITEKQSTFEERLTNAFVKIARPKKFSKFEFSTQRIAPNLTLAPASVNKSNDINQVSSTAKTSSYGDYIIIKVTTPTCIKGEHTEGISSDRDVSFEFIKQNKSVIDTVISKFEMTKNISNSVTKPKVRLKPQLKKIKQMEVFKPTEDNKINISKLTGPNKDFTSFRIIDSFGNSGHDPKIVTATTITSSKYTDEAYSAPSTTPQSNATKNNSLNIKTRLTKNRFPYYTNENKFETAKENANVIDNLPADHSKVDEFTKREEYLDSFKSMTDFDNYETIKIFQDNVIAKSNEILNIKEYNVSVDNTKFYKPSENPNSFQLSEFLNYTEEARDFISNTLKPSTIVSRQYNGNRILKLRVAKTLPSSIKYFTQSKNANKKALHNLSTQNYESFRLEKATKNNEIRTSADKTYHNEDESKKPKDSLNDLLTTEKVKNIDIEKYAFENILEIKNEPNFYATQMSERTKSELVPLFFGVTEFSSSTVDKIDEVPIIPNILMTSNTPKQYSIKPKDYAVTKKYTKTHYANSAALTDPVALKNNSYAIKKSGQNSGMNNKMTSSHVTVYPVQDKTHDFYSKELLNTDTNKANTLKYILPAEHFKSINENSDIIDIEEITKKTKWYEPTAADNVRTRYVSSKNETDLQTLSQTSNYFEDTLSYTEGNFEEDDINLKKTSIILNQQQADVFDDLTLDKPLPNSGEFYIETNYANSTPSRDHAKIMEDTTRIHNILKSNNDITVGYLTDNDLRETLYKELILTSTDKLTTLNALESIELVNNSKTKSGIFHNYHDTTEVPSFDATITGTDLRTKYYKLIDKKAVLTIPDESNFFTQAAESAPYLTNGHNINMSLSNDVKTSYFSSSQNFRQSSEYPKLTQTTIKNNLKDQHAYLNPVSSIVDTRFGMFNNDLEITETPNFDATLIGEVLRTKYRNLSEKGKLLTTNGSHITQTVDNSSYNANRHNETIIFFNAPHLLEYQKRTQSTIESTLREQDASMTDNLKKDTKSVMFNNFLDKTGTASFDTTIGVGVPKSIYHTLENETERTTLTTQFFIKTAESLTSIENRFDDTITHSNNVTTSRFFSPQYISHNLKVAKLHSSKYQNVTQNAIKSTLRYQNSQLGNDIQSGIFHNYLEKPEALSFNAKYTVGVSKNRNHNLLEKGTELTIPNKSQFITQTTESSTFNQNGYGDNVTLTNNEKTSHYSSPQDAAVSHNLEVVKLNSSKCQNGTQTTIKPTLKDQDSSMNYKFKKTEETTAFNNMLALNYATVGNLSKNETQIYVSKSDLTTNVYDSLTEFQPIKIEIDFGTQPDITNEPIGIRKEFNYDETQTEVLLKNPRSQKNKSSDYSTDLTTPIVVDLKTIPKEETYNLMNSVMLNSFEDKQKDFSLKKNFTAILNLNKTSTDKKSQFDDKFIRFEKSINITNITAPYNKTANDMAKKETHEINILSITDSIKSETHKYLESNVVTKIDNEQPNKTDNYFKITSRPSIGRIHDVSLLNNLSSKAYKSFAWIAEPIRQTKHLKYFENTTFTAMPFDFLTEETVASKENEITSNTAKISSFINSNYTDKVSYASTESLLDFLIRHDVSTDTIVPFNNKFKLKKGNTEKPDTDTMNEILVHNFDENQKHSSSTLSSALHITELEKSQVKKDLKPAKINDSFTRYVITDTQITVTEKPSLYKTEQVETPSGNYDFFQYPQELTTSINVITMDDNRNNLTLVGETNELPKEEYTKHTVRSVLNVAQDELHSATEYNKPGFPTVLISEAIASTKDDMSSSNSVKQLDTLNYYNTSRKQNILTTNDVDSLMDSTDIKESVESMTDMLALIESVTDSYDHFLDDLNILDKTNIGKVTGVKPTSNKMYNQNEISNKMHTITSPLEGMLLESQAIEQKEKVNFQIITQFNVTKNPEIAFKSVTKTDQQSNVPTSDFNVKSDFNQSLNIISTTRIIEPSKIHKYETLHSWLTSKPSNFIENSKSGNDHPDHFDNSYSEKKTEAKTMNHFDKVENVNIAFYNTASVVGDDDIFLSINEPKMTIEKKPTTVDGLEINTKYEKKNNAEENVITAATEMVTPKVNITTIVNNEKTIGLFNEIKGSYDKELNYPNKPRQNVEIQYFTGATSLSEPGPHITDTKLANEAEARNVFDGTETTHPTVLGNYPVTDPDLKHQLENKTVYVVRSTRPSDIKVDERNISIDTRIKTTESKIKYLNLNTDFNYDTRLIDSKLTGVQDYTYPLPSTMYNTAGNFNQFEKTIESIRYFMPMTKYTPNTNKYFISDQTRPAKHNYENTENSVGYVSQGNLFHPIHNKTVTTSHSEEKKISFINLTEHSKQLRELKVTEPIHAYREHSSERKLLNSDNTKEQITKIVPYPVTVSPRTTPMQFLLDEVFTKHKTVIKTHPGITEDYFVTSTMITPSIDKNLTVPSHMEILEGTEDLKNEIILTTVTDSINSFSTLSTANENIITKRNTKPNDVADLTLSLGKKPAMDGGAMLFNVPPLAFHVTDLKLELVPNYSNNKSQIIPKLHGKFNISLNMESQHVNDSTNHNNTLDVLNKAFADQMHPAKLAVNATYGSKFKEPHSEMKKYIANAHDNKTRHYLSNLVTSKEFLSNNINNISGSQTVKYLLAKNITLWKESKNINIERKYKNNEFATPEIGNHTDLAQYTESDIEKQAIASMLLQSNTNRKGNLRTSPPLPDQYSATDSYKYNTSTNGTNNVGDIDTFTNTTSRDSNQVELNNNGNNSGYMEIYNLSNGLQYEKMNNVNLARSSETPLTFENKKTNFTNNMSQGFQSRRHGIEPENFLPKPNKGLIKIIENKLMETNSSENSQLIYKNTINTKVKSNLNKTNIKTLKSLSKNNLFSNMNSIINGTKINSNYVPIKSKKLRTIDAMRVTETGNFLESATENQNLVNTYDKMIESKSADVNKSLMEPTAKMSQLSKSKWNTSSELDDNKLISNLMPIISQPLHNLNITTITVKIDPPELVTLNQNGALFGHKNTHEQNPEDNKKIIPKTTTNMSQFSRSKADVSNEIDSNKLNSNLPPIFLEPLHVVKTTIITEKGDQQEISTPNHSKTLSVHKYNKTGVHNYADPEKSSTKINASTLQLTESKPYTITPIVLNIVFIVDKINKKKNNCKYKNAKAQPNKTTKFVQLLSTGKELKSNTQGIELQGEVEKSSISISKFRNLPNIRKAYNTITLAELSTKRNLDPGVTNQNTDMLTSVDLNAIHTTESHNARIKDKNKHLTELRKHQNSKPKLLDPLYIKNGNRLTSKTENNLDPEIKYETFSLNQQVHVTSKSLLRTTRKIKYNTYRPLTDEELDPIELHKIISSFPKYDTKKVKTKNPQQVKNYHAPSGIKSNTKQDMHNKSSIYDPLNKKNIYPVKKLISNPRKIIKRLKLANKRNDIVTMNTEDFFSRRLGVTRKDKIGDILKLYPKPVLKLRLVTTKPKSVILRPKFSSLNTFTKKPAIKKPVILQNMDVDYYRSLAASQYRRSGAIWGTAKNKIPEKPAGPTRVGFGDPVIDAPYYIPTVMKPKFLRDRVNSIRSYIYNAEKKPSYRRHFLNHPGDPDDADDSFVQYSKGNSRDEEDTDTPVHRITKPKKTIFFLSPTIPYNRYF
ncbi:hypothetical protein MSG28_008344 [Choristoneura fumiferana]|uniref:Uncharacterized protein n=1 Tax=Choristoneura fumiferana TaxID=7141 RepID=A0ACC0JAZ8_CHOFU|nr:hypothetical protein MSG28_008344 [Choristoneura fumiferana]